MHGKNITYSGVAGGVATAGIIHTTHASFLREPGGGGSTSSCKTKYLPLMGDTAVQYTDC